MRAFDAQENLRQNLEWYRRKQAKDEQKRLLHNAIVDLGHMTPAQQLAWVKKHPTLSSSVLRYLDPSVSAEIIRQAEREAVEDEEYEEEEKRKRLKKDVDGFLRRTILPGRKVPANKVIAKATRLGISERTLYRSKAKLRIQSERVGFGPSGHFVWFLPK